MNKQKYTPQDLIKIIWGDSDRKGRHFSGWLDDLIVHLLFKNVPRKVHSTEEVSKRLARLGFDKSQIAGIRDLLTKDAYKVANFVRNKFKHFDLDKEMLPARDAFATYDDYGNTTPDAREVFNTGLERLFTKSISKSENDWLLTPSGEKEFYIESNMKKSQLKQLISQIVNEVRNMQKQETKPIQANPEDYDAVAGLAEGPGAHPGANDWDDDAGYDLNDPKHPTWSDRMADKADMYRSQRRDEPGEDDMMLGNTHDDRENVQDDGLFEDKKFGASSMKKSSDKKENTQMGSDDKNITSTSSPKEKKEGKKLPVVKKKSNTETDHVKAKESTSSLKEEIVQMIRESLEEMARTPVAYDGKRLTGSISNDLRRKDPKSPTGYSLASDYKLKSGKVVPAGTPVDAPKNTGANYVKAAPKPKKVGAEEPVAEPVQDDSGFTFTFVDPSGESHELDSELPWYSPKQLNSYLESEVMAHTGDLAAKLDSGVTNLLNNIKMKPETVQSKDFTLKYDRGSKSVKVSPLN